MSFTIDKAHVEMFSRDVLDLAQQKGSKLRRTLMEEPVVGKSGNFERIGKVAMQERTGRHVDTPLISTPHSRRRVDIKDWEIADLVDEADRLKVIIQPQSDYARVFGFAAGRRIDESILAALNGTALDGDGVSVAFDAGNSPSLDLTAAGGSQALILQDVIDAHTLMMDNDVDDSEEFHLVMSARGLRQLLGQAGTSANLPHIGSGDYSSLLAIQRGILREFGGFTWHIVSDSILPVSSADRFAMFYTRFGGKTGMQQEPRIRISERADKSYSTQVYISTMFGVVRMDEARVGRILYTPASGPDVS